MANTFYFSEKFNISDYEPTNSKVTIEFTLEQLALNGSLRSLLKFIPFVYKEPEKEVNAFCRYLSALQFGYNTHRDLMLEKLSNSEKLFIQIRDEKMAQKVISSPDNYLHADKRFYRDFTCTPILE